MSEPQNTFACDPSQIDAFLEDRLADSQESCFLLHLRGCDECRQEMESRAAEKQEWQNAMRFLKDEAFDTVSLGSSADVPDESVNTSSVQINSVLSVLAPTDDPQMLGRLGTYEVSGVIGSGGMGVVLKGHDRSLDRIIAIKVLAPHLATSGAARKRFAREAKAAAAVLHPNVIAIHGVSNDAALPYLVMPYIVGSSLQRRIDLQGPLETAEILRIGHQIAGGLAAAHLQGLVHRDIKPANILLADGVERVAITDFGLARAVDDATMTRSGVIAGTPQYMSPEQARGEPIDARSDLFSLGSVLYAMSTGHSPFRAESSFGVLRRITDDTPRDIRQINPNIPSWLCRLIELLHTKDADRRISSAQEVESLLHHCIAHLEQPDLQPLPERLREVQPTPRAKLVTGIVAAALMVIAAVSVSVWNGPASSPTTPLQQPNSTVAESVADIEWDDGVDHLLDEVEVQIEQLDESTSVP